MGHSQFNFRNEKLRQVVEYVELHPHEYTIKSLADRFNLTTDQVSSGLRRAKQFYKLDIINEKNGIKSNKLPSSKKKEYIPPPPNTENVLVIGDTHEPFTLDGYREFCYATADKYNVTHVIHIGDLIDNHFASFHTTDPDGAGGGRELDLAIDEMQKWVKLFPKADVVIGNHDRIITRKLFEGGIPRRWMMSFQDVLGAPSWNFQEDFYYDGVQYLHGEGGTARTRSKKDLASTVQGHLHPQAYTEWLVGKTYKIFGMQVGCGVDRKAYNMAYAKNHPKPAIGCGVVLNHGQQPINVMMDL